MPQLLPLSLTRRRPGRIRPELGPLRRALAELGDPQLAVPSALVVGTNGKGSTAVMLEAVLGAHGVATGCTTSPHLIAVEERIRIGGRAIARARLEAHLDRLAPYPELTFFETLTAAAFLAFADAGVEVAVLEAGMGGSWDATRVADSAVAGITNVGLDHTAWLGADAATRARDKGAPLRTAEVAVIGPGLRPVVGEVAVFELDDERAMPLDRLAGAFPGAVRASDLWTALDRLPDPVVAAGSLRLAGALLEATEDGGRHR